MKTHRSLMSGMAVFVLIIMGKGASPAVAQGLTQVKAALQQEMSCQGATLGPAKAPCRLKRFSHAVSRVAPRWLR